MRSNAWLAASVWLWLARLPPPACRVRRSRRLRDIRLRDMLAAVPGLLAHGLVAETVKFCRMGPKLIHTTALWWSFALEFTRSAWFCRLGRDLEARRQLNLSLLPLLQTRQQSQLMALMLSRAHKTLQSQPHHLRFQVQ